MNNLERLRKKDLDLIIGPIDVRTHESGLPFEFLFTDTIAFVVSPGHPLAHKRKPTWREAAEIPWIMPPKGTLIRRGVETAFV